MINCANGASKGLYGCMQQHEALRCAVSLFHCPRGTTLRSRFEQRGLAGAHPQQVRRVDGGDARLVGRDMLAQLSPHTREYTQVHSELTLLGNRGGRAHAPRRPGGGLVRSAGRPGGLVACAHDSTPSPFCATQLPHPSARVRGLG